MARKFGKKHEIDLNPLHYNIMLLGESGIGKTTLAKEVCETLVGEEGYIHFDIGKECGSDAIEGIISEKIEDWETLSEVVDDIVENKQEDYSELEVVIWDTIDELVMLAENEAIRIHNRKNPDKKADSINSAWGGFGKGQDKALELIFDTMWKLRSVGVYSFCIGHVKRSDIIDPITQENFSKLTSDSQQRYFNGFKNKMHFVGLGYIDRDIVKAKTGRKNIVTKEDITINKIVNESRMISFRDDTYSVDSKSRFADIIDHINFDSQEFIEVIKDAIMKERSKSGKSKKEIEKHQKEIEEDMKEKWKENSENAIKNKVCDDKNAELIEIIRENFGDAEVSVKKEIKSIMKEYNFSNFNDDNIPTEALKKIVSLLSSGD